MRGMECVLVGCDLVTRRVCVCVSVLAWFLSSVPCYEALAYLQADWQLFTAQWINAPSVIFPPLYPNLQMGARVLFLSYGHINSVSSFWCTNKTHPNRNSYITYWHLIYRPPNMNLSDVTMLTFFEQLFPGCTSAALKGVLTLEGRVQTVFKRGQLEARPLRKALLRMRKWLSVQFRAWGFADFVKAPSIFRITTQQKLNKICLWIRRLIQFCKLYHLIQWIFFCPEFFNNR